MDKRIKIAIAVGIVVILIGVIILDQAISKKTAPTQTPPTENEQRNVTQIIPQPTSPASEEQEHPLVITPTTSTTLTPPAEPDTVHLPEVQYHTIQPGDTYVGIAKKYYGDSILWKLISDANPQYKPEALPVGKRIVIPPKPSTTKTPDKEPDVSDEKIKGVRIHTVQQGDTLWEIAQKYYGKGYMCTKIITANPDKLKSAHTILTPGMQLVIPE